MSFKIHFRILFYCLVITGLLFSGCNTRIEGCLELNASNFNLEAERSCDGCCTYPSANLSLTQKWGDDNFTNADTLFDMHGQPYQINDLKYFLSAWSWRDGEGIRYTVDSVTATCQSEDISFTPDILTTDTRKFTYELGTIRLAPLTDSLSMTLGLVEDFSCLDPDDATTPENLTDQSPLWNQNESRLETIRLILQRDIDSVTYDTVFITTKMDFRFPYVLAFRKGFTERFELTVDYAQWFQEADVTDLSTFSTSILTHIQGSIRPTN